VPSRLVVFESRLGENFRPLSLTRPTFDFLCGTLTIFERLERTLGSRVSDALVPPHVAPLVKEKRPALRVNEEITEPCLAVNSLISPSFGLKKEIERSSLNTVAFDPEGIPIFARLEEMKVDASALEPKAPRAKRTRFDTPGSLMKYPWELVSQNGEAIEIDHNLVRRSGSSRGSSFESLGDKISISDSAEIEKFVTLDSRNGPVVVDDNAIVESFSHITGPAYVGDHSVIKSARIRAGTSIGKMCKIGGEIEESIFLGYSNKNHDGFIGHSLVGSWVNLGALTTNSDLKNTYGRMHVSVGGSPFDTGREKVGCFIGDMCKSSIGALIFGGKKIGVSSHLFGTVFEDVPSFTIYSKKLGESKELNLESAIETQRRMMARRGQQFTKGYEKMMRSVFKMTARERLSGHVKKGKFRYA
jgi:UDP-N-acetylglucosamine diphosphorylase/glucosamine-1-phosphate N-acetyltransferase